MLETFATEVKKVWILRNPVTNAFQPKSVGKMFSWELQPKPVLVEMIGPMQSNMTLLSLVSSNGCVRISVEIIVKSFFRTKSKLAGEIY